MKRPFGCRRLVEKFYGADADAVPALYPPSRGAALKQTMRDLLTASIFETELGCSPAVILHESPASCVILRRKNDASGLPADFPVEPMLHFCLASGEAGRAVPR